MLRNAQPATQHFDAHIVIGSGHFERNATLKARADTNVERFQFRRRAVGGDHDLLGAVEQRVQEMAELMLDRLALQELHVVDDQKIDVAQLFLNDSALLSRMAVAKRHMKYSAVR